MRQAERTDFPAPQRVLRHRGETYLFFDADGDGALDYVQRIHDGYKDQLFFLDRPPGAAPRAVPRPAGDLPARRLVLLLLDGVAWERIVAVRAAGRFRLFRPPARLIGAFPTLTDPVYDEFFGTGPTPGFEAGAFDRARNRTRPGLLDYIRGRNEAWVRCCDYRLSFLADAVMYLFPRRVFRSELRRARRVLDERLAQGRRIVSLYILSTDGLGHMLSPAAIEVELARLDDWIERALYDHGGELEMVVASDHGLGCLPAGCARVTRFDLRAVLRAAGLRVGRRLRRSGDCVVPGLGLLDVARLYAYDTGTRDRVVAALCGRPEIELVIVRDEDRLRVLSAGGSAEIRQRPAADGQAAYSYTCMTGDPLGLAPACAALWAAGRLSSDNFARAADWLRASADLPYPAAPPRLWRGLFVLTREQPDVVLSLNERCYAGSSLLGRFVSMQGTHGGLHRRVSETFAMSTGVDFDGPTTLPDVAARLRSAYGWAADRAC